jgi:hypothetical protein
MNLDDILKSKEYLDARARVGRWKSRLDKGDAKEAAKVRDEKAAYFAKLRKDSPRVYVAFQIDDKTLSELIYKKITGKEITID